MFMMATFFAWVTACFPLLFQRRGQGWFVKAATFITRETTICISIFYTNHPYPSFGKGGESGGKLTRKKQRQQEYIKRRVAIGTNFTNI